MRYAVARLLLGAALSIATVLPASADAAAETDSAKITRLLDASGYAFEKKSDSVWTVDYTGKKLGHFKVILATEDGLAVVFVIVAHKADIRMDQDLALSMLRLNHSLDRVKIGIDDDGDAFVRTDENVRVLDGQEFKACIEQVASSADETYATMQPYLNAKD